MLRKLSPTIEVEEREFRNTDNLLFNLHFGV
jgi:hypothetical protein